MIIRNFKQKSMISAKEELVRKLKEVKYMHNEVIYCASIYFSGRTFELNEGYSVDEFKLFLDSIDFEYDNGYGVQNLYGTVWLTNRTWLEREEYDGAEGWRFYKCPELPSERIVNNL
jgi:hypothetical protein